MGGQSFKFPTPSPKIGWSDPLHILPPKTLKVLWKSHEQFPRYSAFNCPSLSPRYNSFFYLKSGVTILRRILLHSNSEELCNVEMFCVQSRSRRRPTVHVAAAGLLCTALWTVRLPGAYVHRVGRSQEPLAAAELCLLCASCQVPSGSPRRHRPTRGWRYGNHVCILYWVTVLCRH